MQHYYITGNRNSKVLIPFLLIFRQSGDVLFLLYARRLRGYTATVICPRVDMAVKSITRSTGHGTNSEVQNPERRDFLGNIRNTPLMFASSRMDLDNELNRNKETRDNEDFGDGDYPALRPNYDRRAHAHHSTSSSVSVYKLQCSHSLFQISVNLFDY